MEKLNLKIKSVFLPKDRLDELDEIPKRPGGDIDYWKAAELLCKKDGGRLPTPEELAELATYIYGEKIGPYEDNYDVDAKNIPLEFKEIWKRQNWFALWSGKEGSVTDAYGRGFATARTSGNLWRGYCNRHGVCLGE